MTRTTQPTGRSESTARPDAAPDVETASESYAGRFAGSVGRWFLDVQAYRLKQVLTGLPAGSRALDVGGGHGQLTPTLLDAGFEVVVLGSAPECRNRLTPWLRRGRCGFEVGDLQDLPYEDRAFDVVLAFRLLAHASSWRRLTKELCRVARAAVVVDYPSRRSVNVLAGPLFEMKRRVEGVTRPFTLFSPAEIEGAFDAAGFRITAKRSQFLLPMALHRAVGSAVASRALEAPARALGLTRSMGSPVIVRADRWR